jgi:hypothetical protein
LFFKLIQKIKLMKFDFTSLIICLFLVLFSCKNKVGEHSESTKVFGTVFEIEEVISFDDIWQKMTEQDTVKAVVLARVSEVCKTKGCWMELMALSNDNDNRIFVEFDDYSFFMPAHIEGREVYVKGVFFTETTTVDELRFEAEMDGLTAEELSLINEPLIEKNMMASGVIIK